VVRTDAGPLPLAVPMRYLDAVPTAPGLLTLPLNAPPGRRRRRDVPQHPLSLLEGASLAGLEATTDGLASAIRVGAPAYNRGDIEGCYRLYAAEARRLVRERSDCPGVQGALQAGLERALRLEDVDDRAWALRDTFDGVLNVIERFLRQRTGGLSPAPAPKASLPN
jgi:serine protease Do